MFKSSKLSREDIESYNSSNNSIDKNLIEQKASADEFNRNAFEGWDENDFDISLMKNLDEKFLPKSNVFTFKTILLTIVFGLILSAAFIYNQNYQVEKQPNTEYLTHKEITSEIIIEETDIILPQLIEDMNNAPSHKQIKPKKIISEFAEMKLIEEKSSSSDVSQLPVKNIESKKDVSIISNRKNGKEIYLSDLKLVDYTLTNPSAVISTKQVLLTGTPANKEDENSEEIEAQWKTIEIPYLEYIEKSLRILNSGNYKKALSRFETILKAYPDDVNSNFYSGYCLFNLGEYDTSIDYFQKCIVGNYSNFDEESEWMTAQCYQFNGDKNKAKKTLQKIIDSGGYYANQAKTKISQ